MTLDQAITVSGAARAKVASVRKYLHGRADYYDGPHEILQAACIDLDLIINHLALLKKGCVTSL